MLKNAERVYIRHQSSSFDNHNYQYIQPGVFLINTCDHIVLQRTLFYLWSSTL